MTLQLTRRPGTSLLEVLVGLGILAVGAISAFVLFPLSAINVSRAMIDDRATTCAITADGQLREIHRKYVVEPETGNPNATPPVSPGTSNEPYHTKMDNPSTVSTTGGASPVAISPTLDGPSYPVFVDPMGRAARLNRGNTGGEERVGDSGQTLIPRVDFSFINGNANLALRFCSQMDGLSFNERGEVSVPVGGDARELRYNWLWVLQRPNNRDRHTVRQQVVVFDKRVHRFAPAGSEVVVTTTTVGTTAGFTPGLPTINNVPRTATIGGSLKPVEIRKGSWVMDAGLLQSGPAASTLRHAEFYRVVGVREETNNTYTLDVHRPIVRPDGSTAAYNARLVLMPAVIEVFERPMLTGSNNP